MPIFFFAYLAPEQEEQTDCRETKFAGNPNKRLQLLTSDNAWLCQVFC